MGDISLLGGVKILLYIPSDRLLLANTVDIDFAHRKWSGLDSGPIKNGYLPIAIRLGKLNNTRPTAKRNLYRPELLASLIPGTLSVGQKPE